MEKIPEDVKQEIWENFNEYRIVYFATSTEEQPRVRPVTMVPMDSGFWILTGMKDAKIKQLKINPKVEVCLPIEKDEHTGYARFSGKAQIVKDKEIKRNIANKVDYFKHYWDSPDDPNFALLKLEFDRIEYLRPEEIIAKKYSL